MRVACLRVQSAGIGNWVEILLIEDTPLEDVLLVLLNDFKTIYDVVFTSPADAWVCSSSQSTLVQTEQIYYDYKLVVGSSSLPLEIILSH